MTFWAGFFRAAQLGLVCVVLSGCLPAGSGPLDEEKEPHFLAGKSRISTLDFPGAIACFEKALQVNPQSASAHFELAWIFDGKEPDPAAAIYHYQCYLKLRPNAGNADLAKQRITVCKQAIAETVSLGPVTEKLQRQFEQLTETNKWLLEENKRLHDDLEKWSSYAERLQTLTNTGVPSLATERAAGPGSALRNSTVAVVSPTSSRGAVSSSANRTHTVQAGETPSLIARRYGVKLSALMAANPNLDPRRMKVGQVLRVPGS